MDRMTQDRALARIMGLHQASPGHDALQKELRPILAAVYSAGWSDGHADSGVSTASATKRPTED